MTCICQNSSVAGRQPPGEDVGEGCSVPAAHQNGHSSILNILGNSWGLPIHILRVFWTFLLQWDRQFVPPSWLRLDCRHCMKCERYYWIFILNLYLWPTMQKKRSAQRFGNGNWLTASRKLQISHQCVSILMSMSVFQCQYKYFSVNVSISILMSV